MTSLLPASSKIVLITGPVRSGKSEWAEKLAIASGKPVLYIATAQVDPQDREWQARIEQHRRRRPPAWGTLHVPIALAEAIQSAPPDHCLLIDSLGTWLANMLEQNASVWQATTENLLASIEQTNNLIIFVAEETGWGVVPAYPLGRLFRDRLGRLSRQIGAIANPVYLVVAGYALNLSHLGIPVDTPSAKNTSTDLTIVTDLD
jgi:adenosylcobinamide kinase/adenosylcobinamide-phosphate guanylyltransferase